ncbi:MAG: ABC transporter substrate-binding protein [Phycisphaerae bacterium]|nr:ABC transporter substrate-binding protein [Phycisphaerae bacterium]MDW8262639.1 ABC transporter substrate-binding protein [Phycisphaerales bacterium]
MRKILIGLLGSFLTAVLAPMAAGEEILIGHYGSLTGSEATFGQSTSNGIKLRASEVNAAGGIKGRRIRIIEYDTKGDAREAGSVVTRLVTADKVVAVLGEVASSLSLAGAPICQQNGVPMITPSSTNPRVTQVGNMIFRVCFLDDFQGYAAAKFATGKLGARRIAILQDQAQAYSVGLADFFEKYARSMGAQIVIRQSYNGGEQDFSARLTSIRAANPDVIYVPGYYTDASNIAIQARRLGIRVPLLGGDGWDSAKLIEIGGEAVEGCYFTNHAAPDEPAMVEFAQKYADEFGAQPDALAALAYDAAGVLFDAIARAPSLDGRAIRDAIAATRDFKGVTGTINFDENRDVIKAAVVVQVKNGKLTLAERIEPEKK